MSLVVGDATHEPDESFLLKGLDCQQAVPGADVLVEAHDQSFRRRSLDVRSCGHAVASPHVAKQSGVGGIRVESDQSSSPAMRFGSSAERAPSLVSAMMSASTWSMGLGS